MNKDFERYFQYNEENNKIKIGVAISGGVDSATTAYLLKKQGYDIFGITMVTCGKVDNDAKKICNDLGIPHYILDLSDNFNKKVVNYFVYEYLKGKTPNPCMVCNKYIKLGELLDKTLTLGANYMATGHYAKISDNRLVMGNDLNKDQVYFLSQCKKENLKYLMFPLGDLTKPQVREIAEELGVKIYNKKDSQEICFVEDGKLKEFLTEKSCGKANISGNIINLKGDILGTHNGLSFYTIGQRKGLGISSSAPYYVISLDSNKNQVIVGSNEDLFQDKLIADNINYFTDNLEDLESIELYAKTRSRDKLHQCRVKVLDNDLLEVEFIADEVRAITPGQGIVFYDTKYCVVGSGFIK
ncbi:tRNA 2-thiouridine(34) synthase MnmA [Fusobacterium sp. PH5-44]|uniref:tRNA 2-thiouridine(34) synthase MnmA n=1 Tax=unclassified Fusobacterium TaxID=2648384 RepID=UPI003D23614D